MNAFQKLDLAHLMMVLSSLLFVVATLTAYVWASDQHLLVQGMAHVSMLVLAVVFKLSYVLRLHALQYLGRAVN